MQTAINIVYTILLLSASLLCIFSIIYLNRITKSVFRIEENLKRMINQLSPLIESSNQLVDRINDISSDVEKQVNSIRRIIDEVKERINSVLSLEKRVQDGIEAPISGLLGNLTAVVKGVTMFWKKYRNKE
jgi:uncharacterized protein YoxC